MSIKTSISKNERDELTKDVDDLDKVYLERMKKDGIDPSWLEQFRDISLEMNEEEK